METTLLFFGINSSVSVVFGNNARVFKVQPRTLGGEIHPTAGVTCPAVKALIPKVVRVGISGVLDAIVTFSVEPILAL